jgi:predicted acylesterase/phospholipase RssA
MSRYKRITLLLARATVSVPGYFPPMKIFERFLVGGSNWDTMNPSWAAFNHLRQSDEFSGARLEWVNLGAGSPAEGPAEPPKRGSSIIPIKDMLNRMKDIRRVWPEITASWMQILAQDRILSSNQLSFTRFSEDVDESVIEWDEYPAMNGLLQQRTMSYLARKEVSERLQQTAKRLAQHCRQKQAKTSMGSD